MAVSTLLAIQQKVRKLTRSPSVNQLTDTAINEYVNTFIAYDFPENLRLFQLHTTFNMELEAFKPTYDLATLSDGNNGYMLNTMITMNPPVYIDGYKAFFTQSRDEFYNIYPQNQGIVMIGAGDGTTTTFSYVINNGFLVPDEFQVTSITDAGTSLYLTGDNAGALTGDGTGTVNYITGAVSVTFNTAPGQGQNVNAHVVQYTPGRPSALLYYQDQFVVRPIPDQPYTMNFEYYIQPTQLMETSDHPELDQWWQYIAYGAAKKVFEDRMDLESVQQIMPEYKNQERLVLRKTIVQLTNQRTATIYSQQSGLSAAYSNFYNGF